MAQQSNLILMHAQHVICLGPHVQFCKMKQSSFHKGGRAIVVNAKDASFFMSFVFMADFVTLLGRFYRWMAQYIAYLKPVMRTAWRFCWYRGLVYEDCQKAEPFKNSSYLNALLISKFLYKAERCLILEFMYKGWEIWGNALVLFYDFIYNAGC